MNKVDTTKIEKKYKDKKTGEWKSLTINYALVPDRLLAFRQENPRSLIETSPEFQAQGILVFKARLLKDKKDPNSPEATGHAYGNLGDEKAFEKLETQAVGRALALLGYLNNGKVATTEEMQEFENWKQDQMELVVQEIKQATKRDEFVAILAKLTPEQKLEATPLINNRIKELKDGKTGISGTKKS